MSTPALRVDELGKASRRAGMLSAFGVVITLAALFYSYHTLNALSSKRAELLSDITKLNAQKDDLLSGIKGLQYSAVTADNQVLQIKASARHVTGKTSGGDPLYSFSVYVNAAPVVISKIARVAYDFDHPTFKQPHREATDPANQFQVQYTGWGCLSDVDVKVFFKDGTSQKIDFDMCGSLGTEWNDFTNDK